jgi:hypothetical protein
MTTAKMAPTITGQGYDKATGRRVFAVASRSEANRWYLVTVGENALNCDCKAGQFHPETPCAHRKVVHAHLVSERAAAAEKVANAAAAKRDTAPVYRSNALFSIWKS